MNGATFDAIAAARELEATGLERQQAEVIVNTMRDVASAGHDALATKGDIAGLEVKLAGLETHVYRALWILAAMLIGSQVAIAGFVVVMLEKMLGQ